MLFAAGADCKKTPPAVPVNLNTAGAEQIEQVPGIGPGTAKAIVSFREKSGPFQRIEDLLAIRGITVRKLKQLRPYVTVTATNPTHPAAKP
jgi:competence protein ComEA